jgi:pyruvate/2-oxoglutarate dehydrogenase complex dihydrolipoamide acyltransferase (E2) component
MKPPTLAPAESTLQRLRHCAAAAQRTLVGQLSHVYANAADRLRANAEYELHARSGRTLFLSRASELTRVFDQVLSAELAAALEQFAALDDMHVEVFAPESMVPGVDTFEQQLLYDRVTYRHSDPREPHFQELGWRLARLRNLHKVPPRANPLRASVFFRAFTRAFVQLEVYAAAVLPLTKSLDSPLAAPLRDVYRHVNAELRAAGVDPLQGQLLPPATAVRSLIAFSDQVTDSRTETALRDDVLRIDPQPVARTQEPAAQPAPATGPAPAPSPEAQEAAALARSLAARMGYELIRFDSGYPPSISDIRKVTVNAGTHKLVRLSIEFVHTLFQSVVDDGTVPEDFLNLVLHIQIPMLRMTLAHAEYVPTQKAPGQPLMRRLCAAAAGWTPNGEFNQRLLQAARDAVRPLVAQSDAPPEQFHASLLQFVGFLEAESRTADNPIERIRKARAAAEERQAGEVRITIDIGQRIERLAVPLYLRDFLLGPWVSVLQTARERAAVEPGFAAPFESLVDELLWSVQDKTDAEERERMTATIPQLLATIYRGMSLIGKEPTDVKDLIANLMGSHAAAAAIPDSVRDIDSA